MTTIILCFINIVAMFLPIKLYAETITQEQYAQDYAYNQIQQNRYTQVIKQPDAQISYIGKHRFMVDAYDHPRCMQLAEMSNGIIAPIPCGHIVGEYLHAITTSDGMIIVGYITTKEYKEWIK